MILIFELYYLEATYIELQVLSHWRHTKGSYVRVIATLSMWFLSQSHCQWHVHVHTRIWIMLYDLYCYCCFPLTLHLRYLSVSKLALYYLIISYSPLQCPDEMLVYRRDSPQQYIHVNLPVHMYKGILGVKYMYMCLAQWRDPMIPARNWTWASDTDHEVTATQRKYQITLHVYRRV